MITDSEISTIMFMMNNKLARMDIYSCAVTTDNGVNNETRSSPHW